jgi:hypothetical protein
MTRALVVTPWVGSGAGTDDPYRPLIADAYPVAWEDVTAQESAHVALGVLPYTVAVDANASVLNAIATDARFGLVQRDDATLTSAEVRSQLASVLHADVAAYVTRDGVPLANVLTELLAAQRRPPWAALTSVAVGDVVAYGTNLYRCVQAHATQSDWTPPVTPALWVRFHEPSAGPQPWVQPTGAHDAYQKGDLVTFQGSVYRSKINSNVWSPTAYPAGWELVP